MEHYDGTRARIPGEIVSVYRRPEPAEVVLTYTRLLPGAGAAGEASRAGAPRPPKAKKRERRRGLWIFLACFAAAALLAAGGRLLGGARAEARPHYAVPYPYDEQAPAEQDRFAEVTIPGAPFGQGVELTVLREYGAPLTAQEIYRQVNPSVVMVVAHLEDGSSMGTGVIFTDNGYVLTNHHILAGANACTVALDTGHSYEARYVAGDADHDLAILKIDERGLPAASFGDSDLLTVGDPAYAIGNPLNYELLGTLTDGIISAIDREVWVDGRTMTLIQTNAALNFGNSGGPLINQYGQVVGINVIKMSSVYDSIEGLGFAIPSAVMDRVINDLLAFGEPQPEPLLGITVIRAGTELEEGLWGLAVDAVTPGSAADAAGIRVGDYVTAADGEPLMSSKDLLRVRRHHYVGDELPMSVWRDGEVLEVVLVLEEAAEDTAS